MPGAIIAIDQDQGAPSFGTPGVARNDLRLGRLTTVRSTASGNISYAWSLLDKPPGSAVTLGTPTAQDATFTPDLPGSYRVQLVTNGGGPGNVQILVAAVTKDFNGLTVNRGWRIPALGEVVPENNFNGQDRGWDEALRYIFNDFLTMQVAGFEIIFAVESDSTLTTFARQGIRTIDMSRYPLNIGIYARKVRFVAVLENSLHSALYNAEVRLFDYTNGVAVTSTTLNNTAPVDRSIATEFTSAELTVGGASGNIRNDAPTMYRCEFRAVGVLTPPLDRVVLGNAFLRISYE